MKYKSITTPNFEHLGPAYIAEILISRQEAKDGRKLSPFWWRDNDDLKKRYRQTIFWVRSLLSLYSEQAFIKALTSKEGNWIYSTANKNLEPLIQKEQQRLNDLKNVKPIDVVEGDGKTMPNFGKKNTISRLKDLDE